MARVEIVFKHSKFEFQDEVNKIIQNLKFKEFDIRYSANESYPAAEAERNSPERFFSAMIIIKDEK